MQTSSASANTRLEKEQLAIVDDQLFVIHELWLWNNSFYNQQPHTIWRPEQNETALRRPAVPSFTGLRSPDGPDSSLPLSSPDTAEGSAHGNNPENRARRASRKNSDMFSESGL